MQVLTHRLYPDVLVYLFERRKHPTWLKMLDSKTALNQTLHTVYKKNYNDEPLLNIIAF